jgi:hypothetical protein
MNERMQSQAPSMPKSSFAPIRSNLLQRKCACGGTPGLDGECAECRRKRLLGSQRNPSDQADHSEVPRIVNRVPRSTDRSLDESTRASSEATFGHDFSKIPVHARASVSIQPSLAVSSPGDPYEREATRKAEEVMRMPDLDAGDFGDLPLKRKGHDSGLVQRATELGYDPARLTVPDSFVNNLGPGQPLDDDTRAFFEPRFGYDFSQVRLHTDAQAAESAKTIGALAYTAGRNVVFGASQYAPQRDPGMRLLAHELAHVIQQGAAVERTTWNQTAPEPGTSPSRRKDVEDEASETLIPGYDPPADRALAAPRTQSRLAVQRQAEGVEQATREEAAAPQSSASGPNQSWASVPRIGPAIEVDLATGRTLVREFNGRLGPYATHVIPFPDEPALIASVAEETGGEQTSSVIQAFAAPGGDAVLQRAGGGRVPWEAGVVGSLQVCYDLCSGEVSLIGWIWGGAGIETRLGWYGAFLFAEQEFYKGNPGLGKLDCGTCDAHCHRAEEHGGGPDWGAGFAGFPVVIKPGEQARIAKAGLEVGFLITPRSLCDADVEVIALLDLLQYLGPVGAAVSKFAAAATEVAERFGTKVECQLGIDISGSVHLCKSVPGGGIMGVTADKAKVCGGGYAACGLGLSHEKSALPH